MPEITIQRRLPASAESLYAQSLAERIAQLQRRITAMLDAARDAETETRRQRAAGRRP